MSERSGTLIRCCAAFAVTAVLSGCTVVHAQLISTHSPGAPPASSAERAVVDSLNRFRGEWGLPALKVQGDLANKARSWAEWMAAGNCGRNASGSPGICHSSLTNGIHVQWSVLAENVGAASPPTNLGGVMTGFEHSSEHAANILNRNVTSVGAGVAYADNMVFVVEEFMG